MLHLEDAVLKYTAPRYVELRVGGGESGGNGGDLLGGWLVVYKSISSFEAR